MGLYPNPDLKTGHFTCYKHRTDHLLTTPAKKTYCSESDKDLEYFPKEI